MNENAPKKNILMVGPYPLPYGGVSVHLRRMVHLLIKDFNIKIVDESKIVKEGIFNIYSFNFIQYIKLISETDFIHIHSGKAFLRFGHFLIAKLFKKKIIVTIHSYSVKSRSFVVAKLDNIVVRYSDKAIFVSEEISQRFNIKNFFIKEAFIPPIASEEEHLPEAVINWIALKHQEGFIICCANAWRLERHNNEDLYGLDLCIETIKQLKAENHKVAFIFVVSNPQSFDQIQVYKKLIDSYGLNGDFIIYDDLPISFFRLIEKCDIVVRPTNTDGDALTVREGLFLNKPVIASDVVRRPEGTKLFKTRDVSALCYTIKQEMIVIDKPCEYLVNHSSYFSFYRDLIFC